MKTRPKTSYEVRTYEFPFGMQPELEAGATISGIDSITTSGTPGELVLTDATVFGTSVYVTASGGLAGTRYLLQAKVTLNTGTKLEASGVLSIVNYAMPSV